MKKTVFLANLVKVLDKALPADAQEEHLLIITIDKVLHILQAAREAREKQEVDDET